MYRAFVIVTSFFRIRTAHQGVVLWHPQKKYARLVGWADRKKQETGQRVPVVNWEDKKFYLDSLRPEKQIELHCDENNLPEALKSFREQPHRDRPK